MSGCGCERRAVPSPHRDEFDAARACGAWGSTVAIREIDAAAITEALVRNLGLPPDTMTRRVKQKSNPSPHTRRRSTPCICQMCEADGKDPYYTRHIFWTGTLPARIRCPKCARSVGLKDYEEVHDYE